MQFAWSLVRRHRRPLALGALLIVTSRAAALAGVLVPSRQQSRVHARS
jgi:hypothetical protein